MSLKGLRCILSLLVLPILMQPQIVHAETYRLLEDDLLDDQLLAGDELELVFEEGSKETSWRQDFSVTVQQTFLQGEKLEISRSELRLEYEVAPWKGAYLHLDNKYSYYAHHDQQLGSAGVSFGHNKLQEAWLQVSESACMAKLGRQGLYWGVVEGTFALDISPFDFTEPLLTDYSNIRLSQDMLLANCYFATTQLQSFYVASASLDVLKQKDTAQLDKLENTLREEWGVRVTQSWEGLDIALMYAHLYGNTPLTLIDISQPGGIRLDVSRYDLFGISSSWAVGRLLLELDLAYKKDRLENYSGKEVSNVEAALGFEYTTYNNHHLNAGIWLFEHVTQAPTLLEDTKSETVQSWTMGWSKTYFNDDLTMSFLGLFLNEPQILTSTVLAQYQWDDYWSFSSALSYTDAEENAQSLALNDSDFNLLIKVQFQF